MSKNGRGVSRRSFIKWSAAAAALSGGLTACGGDSGDDTAVVGGGGPQDNPDALLEGGEWVVAPCINCFATRCVNKVYVKDGIVLRQKTEDTHPHSIEYPQFRSCIKGRSMRWAVYTPERIKYPMKRKNWKPGGGANSNGHLRGKDEWVRISWKEALDLAASEFKRIHDTYGSSSNPNNPKGHSNILNVCSITEPLSLNYAGIGTVPIWGQTSSGAWPAVVYKIRGFGTSGYMDSLDRLSLLNNSKLILLWGANPAWSKFGPTQMTYREAKERGTKIICVDPWFNPGNNTYADQWIPVRPGTDAALLLAVAYLMITHDADPSKASEPRWIDKAFLDNHTYGYDRAHMPLNSSFSMPILDELGVSVVLTGTDPDDATYPDLENPLPTPYHKDWKNNFKDYILGTFDSVPKTPEWASAICGTPVDLIEYLAEAMGTIKPMAMKASYAAARTTHGGTMAQAFYTVGWMTGNVGKPGADISGGEFYSFGSPMWLADGSAGVPTYDTTGFTNTKATRTFGDYVGSGGNRLADAYNASSYYGVPFSGAWEAVLTGNNKYLEGVTDPVDIKAICRFHGYSNFMNQITNVSKAVKAYRSVEFVFACEIVMSTTAQHADIVIPCISRWEQGHTNTINHELYIGNPNPIIEPIFEAKNSLWADDEILQRLMGTPPGTIKPDTDRQAMFNILSGATVDGGKLIGFTQEEITDFGVTGTPQTGQMSFSEFKKKGTYQVRRYSGDSRGFQGVAGYNYTTYSPLMWDVYVADTVSGHVYTNNAADTNLMSETGRLEIYSMNLYKYYKHVFGFTPLHPIAKYEPDPDNGYERVGADYPLQLVTVHPYTRYHSTRVDRGAIQEIHPDAVYINPVDAERYNLHQGETALLTSQVGRILKRVSIIPTIMPGVVMVPEGASTRMDETDPDNPLDIGGNPNSLTNDVVCGEGNEALNSNVVRIEPWQGEPLLPNYKQPLDIITFTAAD
jgi:anaerobic dimethyl sulfoxide reductase subunit A